jgi:hypothetical protein
MRFGTATAISVAFLVGRIMSHADALCQVSFVCFSLFLVRDPMQSAEAEAEAEAEADTCIS